MDVVELSDDGDEEADVGTVTSVGFVGSKIDVIDVLGLEVDDVVEPYEPPDDDGTVEMAVGVEVSVELGTELDVVDPLEVSVTGELELEPEAAVDGSVTDDIEVPDDVPAPPTGAVTDVDVELESLELEDVGATTGPVEVGLPAPPPP